MSSPKSAWPGVSSRLTCTGGASAGSSGCGYSKLITEVVTEIPRSRSISIQSEVVARPAFLARTAPASWIAPE